MDHNPRLLDDQTGVRSADGDGPVFASTDNILSGEDQEKKLRPSGTTQVKSLIMEIFCCFMQHSRVPLARCC